MRQLITVARHGIMALTVAAFAICVPDNSPVYAQTAQGQPAPPTRGELGLPQNDLDGSNQPTLSIDGSIERSPCVLDNPDFAAIRVELIDVNYVGAELADDVDLKNAAAPYIGRSNPISVLCDIRARAAEQLTDAGYLAAVEIPEQRIRDGVAEIRIVLGKLTSLRLRGEAGPSEKLIASYLQKLVGQPVFNIKSAERYLLLADDLPGVDVRLSLQPAAGGEPGDLAGDIAIARQKAIVDLNLQNYGSRALGRFGGLLRGEMFDLLGLGDRTGLALFSTLDFKEQHTVQFKHESRLGSEGFAIGAEATYSWTDPSLGITGFDVESTTLLLNGYGRYPIKRRRDHSSFVTAGFNFVDQDVEVNNIALSRDRVRVGYVRLDAFWIDRDSTLRQNSYSATEPKWRIGAGLEIRHGFDVFGAAPDCRTNIAPCFAGVAAPPSRIEADPTPLLFVGNVDMETRPTPNWTFAASFDFQYSPDPLPAFEEFAGGNYSIGRGYDPGIVLGDSGIAGRFEIRNGSAVPNSERPLAIQPYIFTDATWAWNNDPSRKPFGSDQLWSLGAGVRASHSAGFLADIGVAVPLEQTDFSQSRGDVRLLASITARLFPWRF